MLQAIVLIIGALGFLSLSPVYHPNEPPGKNIAEVHSSTIHSPIAFNWEGAFLDFGSLAHVNRSLATQLEKMPSLQINCVSTNILAPQRQSCRELQALAQHVYHHSPKEPLITVRHAWPPKWQPPSKGKWIIMQPWEYGALPEEWVEKLQTVDEIWVPSTFVKREFVDSGIPSKKVYVIPNGIDPEKFHPDANPLPLNTDKKFKFLFVGATVYRKGPDILLRAYMSKFTAKDDVCLVIKDFGGQGWYNGQRFEKQIKWAQSQPNAPEILHLDEELSSDEIAGLYTACDCFVLPYRGEGFGIPVLEAMACGLPVIVTAGGATDDFALAEFSWPIAAKKKYIGSRLSTYSLVHEGWLLEPDQKETEALLDWAATHPEEGKAKGKAASIYVRQHWTWKNAASRIAERLAALSITPLQPPNLSHEN